ncbi:MAG: hypothetical protein EOO42_05920 [Flavobacteriales bacterium]|nr:MAG: hypothetical protein EOO42_05920 [Flavobacteriales bacterium]
MIRFLKSLTLALVIMFLHSCSAPSYFSPALSGNDFAYLPKPMGSDSVKVKNYISGSIAGLTMPYSSGDVTMGMLNFSRAHTLKNVNIAYGAFGFAGATNYDENFYDREHAVPAFSGKGVYGGGLRTSIGYYDYAGSAEFRILSWENALSFENGAYADFRKSLLTLGDPNIITTDKTTLFTTGIASEIIWHSKRNVNNHYAFKLFYGGTPGLNKSFKEGFERYKTSGGTFNISFFIILNKLYGIIDSGVAKGGTSRLSLGYSF